MSNTPAYAIDCLTESTKRGIDAIVRALDRNRKAVLDQNVLLALQHGADSPEANAARDARDEHMRTR